MMIYRRKFLTTALGGTAGILLGCGGGDRVAEDLPLVSAPGSLYGEWPAGTYVARSEQEWGTLWDLHTPYESPPLERPRIDFSQSTLVGVSLGGLSCVGETFGIIKAERLGALTTVQYRKSPPITPEHLTGCGYFIDFALLPWSSGEVQFKDVSQVGGWPTPGAAP